MRYTLSTDTGGTFTDLVVSTETNTFLYKWPTSPDNPVLGIARVLENAAADLDVSLEHLLGHADVFFHATTGPLNALLSGETAKTALITTAGHRDILQFREGGRRRPFFQRDFPESFVPRYLTFELEERLDRNGQVITALNPEDVVSLAQELKASGVEAVAVCLLWSCVEGRHEQQVGDILAQHLAGVPVTLSHELNPIIREYRRAQSACIDASLKKTVGSYVSELESWLRANGLQGELLMISSQGGALTSREISEHPIHLLKSGPCLAPVAGRYFKQRHLAGGAPAGDTQDAVVIDVGGTTTDLSLVRGDKIPWSQETWIGEPYHGLLTGLSSIDVRSIAVGGGSYAWVDRHGLLQLGPKSAGAEPGPACYGRGGTEPTVTDAAAVLGILDPAYFLGGAIPLDCERARRAVEERVAIPLGLTVERACQAILRLFTEKIAGAVEEITVEQGIRPDDALLICGGGAVGFCAGELARRLQMQHLLLPWTGAVLSASGGVLADISRSYSAICATNSQQFDPVKLHQATETVRRLTEEFLAGKSGQGTVKYWISARYQGQVWDIEIDYLPEEVCGEGHAPALLCQRFHREHERRFGVASPESVVEFVSVWAEATIPSSRGELPHSPALEQPVVEAVRTVSASGLLGQKLAVLNVEQQQPVDLFAGPRIIESSFTTSLIPYSSDIAVAGDGSVYVTDRSREIVHGKDRAHG